jgi:hypothetical protein
MSYCVTWARVTEARDVRRRRRGEVKMLERAMAGSRKG